MQEEQIREVVQEALAESGAFLVRLDFKGAERVELLADHMEGLTMERISAISRYLRREMEEREWDFGLEVSSPGVGQPLEVEQQYLKNVGRDLEVVDGEGNKYKGLLSAYADGVLKLEYTERVPKPNGKGKMSVDVEKEIALEQVKTAKVLIRF